MNKMKEQSNASKKLIACACLSALAVIQTSAQEAIGGGRTVYETVYLDEEFVTVQVDIKPESYPNAFNLNKKGYTSVAILGSADFDPLTIDFSSVRWCGVPADRWTIEDVATRLEGSVSDCHETTAGPDGYPDGVLKFDNEKIQNALFAIAWRGGDSAWIWLDPVTDYFVTLLIGQLVNETYFAGTDCVKLVGGSGGGGGGGGVIVIPVIPGRPLGSLNQ